MFRYDDLVDKVKATLASLHPDMVVRTLDGRAPDLGETLCMSIAKLLSYINNLREENKKISIENELLRMQLDIVKRHIKRLQITETKR